MRCWHTSRVWLLALLLVGSSGCASVDKLADTLNKRHVRSCVRAMGAYAVFVGVDVLAATGGATLAECGQRPAVVEPVRQTPCEAPSESHHCAR